VDTPRYAIDRIEEALEAGDLEPTRGVGEPIANLSRDPDWWVKAFLEREQYADRMADMVEWRASTIAAAVTADQLGDAREMLTRMNTTIARWNGKAPPDLAMEPVTEIWLVTQRAETPGR
jgi:hypothetical protein